MRMTQPISRGIALLLACGLLGACGAAPDKGATSGPSAIAPVTKVAASPAPSNLVKSTLPAVIPLRVGCDPCILAAGTYATSGAAAFLRGLQVTVPSGWFSDEQDAGEFNLHPVGQPDDSIFFWKDLSATPNDQAGTQLAGVSGTATDVVAWLTANPDLIVTTPQETMIGQVPAAMVDVRVSHTAKTPKNSDCHADPCVWFLRDMKHWDHPFAIAQGDIARFYFGTIGQASDPHTFAVEIEGRGFDAPALDAFTQRARPILDSVVIPDVIDN
jgi:hypothetical protein